MDELHGALCSYFLKLIGGQIPDMQEVVVTDSETGGVTKTWKASGLMVRPGAGDLAVMAKFLKDNAITGAAAEGNELSELEKQLAARHKRSGRLPTAEDAKQALAEVGSKLLN